MQRLQDSELLPRALTYFRAAFVAVRGGDRVPYETATRALQPAVKRAVAPPQ